MAKLITIYKEIGAKGWPYRVLIDGQKDPSNRDFEDKSDVYETFDALQDAGFYKGCIFEVQINY